MATPSKQRKTGKSKSTSSPISPRRKQVVITKVCDTFFKNEIASLAQFGMDQKARRNRDVYYSIRTQVRWLSFIFQLVTYACFHLFEMIQFKFKGYTYVQVITFSIMT